MSTGEQEFHAHDEEETTEIATIPASDAMVDSQIATAKRYPRSISRFRKEAEALALLDEDTAGECMYALKRSGKTIEGPSVRFAEIILYAWGNCRAHAEVIAEGPTHLEAEGTFFDLERNIAVRKKIKRRITRSDGRRYDDDMIGVTGNAANSIAFRNAVFAGIPKALWKAIYQRARLASLGEGGTLTQKRQKLLEWFAKLGVTETQVCALAEVGGIEDVKEDELILLRGLANAIRDGEQKIEDLLANGGRNAGDGPDLQERIRQKQQKKPEEPKATASGEKKKDAASRDLFRAVLKKHRPDLLAEDPDSKFELDLWIKEHTGKEREADLTRDDHKKLIDVLQAMPQAGASDEGPYGHA